MTLPVQTIHCKVCGQPVDPAVDVAFGANGKVWFAAHKGKCAEAVGTLRDVTFRMADGLLRLKAPRVHGFFDALKRTMKEQQHGR